MKLVIDETLGNFQIDDLVIKPVHTKSGPRPMKEVIQKKRSKFLSKSLDIAPYTQLDEIQFFKNLTDADEIVYFYDPTYTDINMIRRLKNWLYPEQSISCHPIYHNRATLYMLLDNLTNSDFESPTHVANYIERYCNEIEEWIITTDPKAFYRNNNLSIYKKKKKPFKLFVSENGKPKIKKTGELDDLVKGVLADNEANSKTWLVYKDLGSKLPLDEQVSHHELEADNLPVNVPFVHIVIQPTLN